MNTTDYIKQLIQEISSKGCTIPADLLQNNLEVLVLYARTEAQQEAIEAMFKKPIEFHGFTGGNVMIMGEHITEPEFIEPSQMVEGQWYHYNSGGDWVFRFSGIDYKNDICSDFSHSTDSGITYRTEGPQVSISDNYKYRKATREEVIKYFPNEFTTEPTETNIQN